MRIPIWIFNLLIEWLGNCAQKMEAGLDSRRTFSSIKIYVPAAYHRVVDRASGLWGEGIWRFRLRICIQAPGHAIADGPDEVHRILIAKNVLRCYHAANHGTSAIRRKAVSLAKDLARAIAERNAMLAFRQTSFGRCV